MDSKYQKAKIYKLTSELTDLFYIGSTIQRLSKRKAHHIEWFMRSQKPTSATKIIQLDPKKIKCELIEAYPCESLLDLRKREQHHLNEHRGNPNLVNQCNAYVSIEERREKMRLYTRAYRERKRSQLTSQTQTEQ